LTFFILCAILSLQQQAWKKYWVALFLALLCKEDVGITLGVFGLVLLLKKETRKAGLFTSLISFAYSAFCIFLLLRFFNGEGFFRHQPKYWFHGLAERMYDPAYYLQKLRSTNTLNYIAALFCPLLALPIFAPLALLPAFASISINILSGIEYLTSAQFHYDNLSLPFIFWSSILGCKRLPLIKGAPFLAAALLASGIYYNQINAREPIPQLISKLPTSIEQIFEASHPNLSAVIQQLNKKPTLSISAFHRVVPHLSAREQIYMFPNPFRPFLWGIRNKTDSQQLPSSTDRILISTSEVTPPDFKMLRELTKNRGFSYRLLDGAYLYGTPEIEKLGTSCNPIAAASIRGTSRDFSIAIIKHGSNSGGHPTLICEDPQFLLNSNEASIPLTDTELRTVEGASLQHNDFVQVIFAKSIYAAGEKKFYFRIQADDGARIHIDGKLVFDYSGVHPSNEMATSEAIKLTKGEHSIVIDYLEWGGAARLKVEVSSIDKDQFETLTATTILP